MTPRDAIKTFASKFREKKLTLAQDTADSLEIEPETEDGFAVGLFDHGDLLLVTGGSWHEHFEDCEEALRCAAFLLSDECRLKTVFRGETVASGTVQYLEDGHWVDGPMVGFFIVPFWRAKRVEYHQNRIVTDI